MFYYLLDVSNKFVLTSIELSHIAARATGKNIARYIALGRINPVDAVVAVGLSGERFRVGVAP
jgi:hypothetical protein